MIRNKIALFSAGVALCTFASPVFAQSVTTADTGSIDAQSDSRGDIIVTANRREQKLSDVALSITAVTAQELQLRQITNFQDLTAQVPGFVIQTYSAGQNRLILRGQNSGSAGASVATVFDDVPFNFVTSKGSSGLLAANIDTWDLERVEVLRGPQGTLYGAAAQGGLIKYVTRKPNLERFEAAGEFGAFGVDGGETRISARGVVNVPLLDGKMAFRLSGYHEGLPGFINNPLLGQSNVNSGQKTGFRASLLVQPSETFNARLTVLHQTLYSGGPNSIQVVGAARTPAVTPLNAFAPVAGLTFNAYNEAITDNEFTVYSGELNLDLGFGRVTSLTSYGKLRTYFTSDITIGNAAPGVSNGAAFAGLWTVPISIRQQQTEALEKFNQEVRLASQPGKIEWQIGGIYSTEDAVFDQQYFPYRQSDRQPAGLNILGQIIGGSIQPLTAKSWAGFADVTVHLGPKFEVEAGGRYSATDQTQSSNLILGLLYANPANPATSSVSDRDWTYSVSAKWKPVGDTIVYGRVATGYRPGGPLFALPPAPTYFNSDHTINYEVGARTSLLNGKVNAELTGFWIDWTDIQIITRFTASNNVTYTTTGNAGRARSKGIEFNFSVRPIRGLTLGLLGAYTDAHLTEAEPRFGGVAGDKLAYVPDWAYTINADYEVPIGEGLRAYAGGSYNYIGERYSDFVVSATASNHVALPSYDTLSLHAGVRSDRWSLQLYARNIGNTLGIVSYNNSGGFNQTGVGNVIQPRTLGLVASIRY